MGIFDPIWSLDLAYKERKQARQAMFRNVGCYLAFEQQTQPRYRARSGNRTRDTLVGDKCSHLCAMSSPPLNNNVGLKESHTLCSKLLLTIVLIVNVCKLQKLLKSLSFCSRVEILQNVMTTTPAVHSLERPRVCHHVLPLLHDSFVQWLSLVAFQRYSKTDH